MGTRGPIPKRSNEGHHDTQVRKAKKGVSQVSTAAFEGVPDVIMAPDEDWHPIARMLWDSVQESAFVRFYEPSDWAVLYSICDDISDFKKDGRRSATKMAAINQMLTSLLLTEGDRRRVQIEIDRSPSEEGQSAGVTALAEWAKRHQA